MGMLQENTKLLEATNKELVEANEQFEKDLNESKQNNDSKLTTIKKQNAEIKELKEKHEADKLTAEMRRIKGECFNKGKQIQKLTKELEMINAKLYETEEKLNAPELKLQA